MAIIAQGSTVNGDEIMRAFSGKINGDLGSHSSNTNDDQNLTNGNSSVPVTKGPSLSQTEVRIPKPIEATASYEAINPIAYELSKLPFGTPRRLKIVVVGAGISALSLAHEVAIGRLKNVELKILEKNAGLGGTCHNYLFTWAPNPEWSSYYVSAPEILKYMECTAEKFGLNKYITLSRKVTGARWSAEKQTWEITSRQTDGRRSVISSFGMHEGEVGEDIVEECDVFVNASGFFNHWRWPAVPGRETYQGIMAHSANYDPEIDLTGKRVAVIGNGSSGIQVTTAVQKVASHVSVFVRNPTYITASMGSKYIPENGKSFMFSEEQKEMWRRDPEEYLRFRKAVEGELNVRFQTFIRESDQQKLAMKTTLASMQAALAAKPELIDLLIPTFAVGCRRPTPGIGYLEALTAPNCEVVWGELESFTPKGIRSADGTEREFDVIIAATGFDLSFVPRWPIVGQNGIDLRDSWAENPACYMSCIAANSPNYFTYLGPGSPVGHGSLITAIERVTLYLCDMVHKLQTENYNSFVLKNGVAEAYQSQMFAWLEKTVWGDDCQSSFKNGTKTGALHAFHPGSRLQYFELLRTRRYEDFEWTSLCPEPELAFAWFNNGFLPDELEGKADSTWYLDPDS
ncbi:hypothetical protein B0A52_03577 [Exophiala mesophila]|uniref:FAD/NAD(P)-binding domain-containing protein n=1 Tax=Exophiala mesophila TaxID=212818 RepID=A0A438N9C8_EXOME|nr:hypothetical protein B0A52_03577 [Exophiala mesophila]